MKLQRIIKQTCASTLYLIILIVSSNTVAQSRPLCIFDDVVIDYGFEMGRVSQCKKISKNKFVISVDPEYKPINKSAWYAFSISAEKARAIEVSIYYSWHNHRYIPKISTDKIQWTSLSKDKYKILHNAKVLKMNIEVGKKPKYIAAQEIIDNFYYKKWLGTYNKNDDYIVSDLGLSKAGHKIQQLRSLANSNNWLLIVGRQHPPEVTGALALFAFVDLILADSDLAIEFRKKYNILLVPNLNPDGVAAGNWRYNLNNVDINRDWGIYKQKSIKLVGDAIAEIYKSGDKLVLALDFHSTNKDVFYTQLDNQTKILPLFAKQWLDSMQQKLPGYKVLREAKHNPGLPTFKTALAELHGMPAITYEIGDETDRNLIKKTSKVASAEMMRLLLDYDL